MYEVNKHDFESIRKNFKNIKVDETQIKIDISETEVVFILENSYQQQEEKPIEAPKVEIEKASTLKKLKNLLFFKVSS